MTPAQKKWAMRALETAIADGRVEVTKPATLLVGPCLRTRDGVYEFTSWRRGGGFLVGTTLYRLTKDGILVSGDCLEAFIMIARHLNHHRVAPTRKHEGGMIHEPSNP